jgi:hypothetical protein
MRRFSDDRAALDFVASQIADEAQREGLALSEVERKMLYFSETAWTLPEIWRVSDEFDRDHDQSTYEKKISQLIKKVVTRARKERDEDVGAWKAAVAHLSKHDRYLMVMIEQAGLGRTFGSDRHSTDLWKLGGTVLALVALFAAFTWILYRINPYPGEFSPRTGAHYSPLGGVIGFSLWVFSFFLLVAYTALSWFLGHTKVLEIVGRAFARIFGTIKRD